MTEDLHSSPQRRDSVEFPTFLQEPPTIVFGRTGRQLLILACGAASAFSCWQALSALHSSIAGNILSVGCCSIAVFLSIAVAFLRPHERFPEEWAIILLAYALTPKLYLFLPGDGATPPGRSRRDEENTDGELADPRNPYA